MKYYRVQVVQTGSSVIKPCDRPGIGRRQQGFDPDVEGIRRDIQEEGDRVTYHGLSLLEPPCLRVDAPQLSNTDRPPVTAALTPSGVGLTLRRFHHPRPNSASRIGGGGAVSHAEDSGQRLTRHWPAPRNERCR